MAKRCRICGKRFPTDIALKRHIKAQHRRYYYGIRIGPILAVLILVGATFYVLATAPPQGITPITTISTTSVTSSSTTHSASERPAPDFELPEVDRYGLTGRSIKLSQFGGKPVFLEFMSPLCGHCIKMTPVIKDLEEKYGDRIVFLSIVWPGSGGVELVSKFIQEKDVNWLHVIDEEGKAFQAYGVRGTPTYVILDEDHVEKYRFIGSGTKEEDLEKAILSVIS
ncbi:MAG: redoxin family protein [Thaumarchaeota archaeon]|nr:redoxin family protein [Nitrososphaerota archaeon]